MSDFTFYFENLDLHREIAIENNSKLTKIVKFYFGFNKSITGEICGVQIFYGQPILLACRLFYLGIH